MEGMTVLATDDRTWANAQRYELDFHKRDQWRRSKYFVADNAVLFASLGFMPGDYAGKAVIDLGAGSKLRTLYFEGAHIVAIDPLADKYMEIKHCDLHQAGAVYSLPAEERVGELKGTADLLVCINVLDHCKDMMTVLENIAYYIGDDGIALLCYDARLEPNPMHPLTLDEPGSLRAFDAVGLAATKINNKGGRIPRKSTPADWGRFFELNFILRRND